MANYSDSTRKEQVLAYLKSRAGEWVNGADLANEQVGGSEGLKRLRELKLDGWLIQKRKSPVQGSDQYQYRLAVQLTSDGALAYHDPTKVDRQPEREAPNGGPQPPRVPAASRSDDRPHSPSGSWVDPDRAIRRTETSPHDWKQGKKTRTLEHVFWLERKQRVIGAIGDTGFGWIWGILLPASKSKMTKERRLGHGTAETKTDAIAAVEARIEKLRTEGLPHD